MKGEPGVGNEEGCHGVQDLMKLDPNNPRCPLKKKRGHRPWGGWLEWEEEFGRGHRSPRRWLQWDDEGASHRAGAVEAGEEERVRCVGTPSPAPNC